MIRMSISTSQLSNSSCFCLFSFSGADLSTPNPFARLQEGRKEKRATVSDTPKHFREPCPPSSGTQGISYAHFANLYICTAYMATTHQGLQEGQTG